MSNLTEFLRFLSIRKKYWMIPIVLVIAIFGGLMILSQGSIVGPFIYTLF